MTTAERATIRRWLEAVPEWLEAVPEQQPAAIDWLLSQADALLAIDDETASAERDFSNADGERVAASAAMKVLIVRGDTVRKELRLWLEPSE